MIGVGIRQNRVAAHLRWLEASFGDESVKAAYMSVKERVCRMVTVAELDKECTNR